MLVLVTPPELAVSVADAKHFLRIDHDEDDAMIEGMIRAATARLDGPRGLLSRALMLQTWDLVLDAFPRSEVRIPLAPVQSIVSVSYVDVNGDEQPISSSAFFLDKVSDPGWLLPNVPGWPSTMEAVNAVTIRFIAGHEPGTVPDGLLLAIKQHVSHMYEHRESVVDGNLHEVPHGYQDLIQDYRSWAF